jgi:hypothetical protein
MSSTAQQLPPLPPHPQRTCIISCRDRGGARQFAQLPLTTSCDCTSSFGQGLLSWGHCHPLQCHPPGYHTSHITWSPRQCDHTYAAACIPDYRQCGYIRRHPIAHFGHLTVSHLQPSSCHSVITPVLQHVFLITPVFFTVSHFYHSLCVGL